MKTVQPAPWLEAIPEYVAGRSKEEIAREYGAANPIKLASNENALGPSPKALAAISRAMQDIHLYPDPDSRSLRAAAAGFFGCGQERIIAGNGSDEIIDFLCRAYLTREDEVIIPSCTFSYYRIASLACGAKVVPTAMQDHRIDARAILAAVSPRTKIIFMANPNNPTGTYLKADELLSFAEAVPPQVMLVVDEAYGAFARSRDFLSAIRLTEKHVNLVTVHTLSKSHGLAGLRVGFGIAAGPVMDTLLRIKPPFNVNILAQKAGEAALSDDAFLEQTLANTWESLDFLYASFRRMGLEYVPSQTNFVLVKIGSRARTVYGELLKKGIITRYMANIGLDDFIRVSVGLPVENQAFIAALSEAL